LELLKIQDGGIRHLEKSQKSRYLHHYLTDLYEIWYMTQNDSLDRYDR